MPVKFSVLLSLSQGDNKMTQVVVGSRRSPINLAVGEVGHLGIGFWRPETIYCRIKLADNRLSRLIAVRNSGSPCQMTVEYVCSCCGMKLEAFLNFF